MQQTMNKGSSHSITTNHLTLGKLGIWKTQTKKNILLHSGQILHTFCLSYT